MIYLYKDEIIGRFINIIEALKIKEKKNTVIMSNTRS